MARLNEGVFATMSASVHPATVCVPNASTAPVSTLRRDHATTVSLPDFLNVNEKWYIVPTTGCNICCSSSTRLPAFLATSRSFAVFCWLK